MHIATDGETYGHHHKYGDMALAFALDQIDSEHEIRLTNYGEFLEKHPPETGSPDHREHLMELLPRRGALAQQLRLQYRPRRDGTRNGGLRCVKRSITCGTRRPYCLKKKDSALLKDPWDARNHILMLCWTALTESLWLFFEPIRVSGWTSRTRCRH